MKFTDRALIGLKPKKNAYDVRESDGFVLRIYPSGKKSFQFVFRKDGKQKRVTIGEYPKAYTLKQARKEHEKLYGKLKRGESTASITRSRETEKNIEDLAKRFLQEHSLKNNIKRVYEENCRIMEKNVLSYLGKIDLNEIRRRDVQTCLKKCLDRNAPVAHNHTLALIRKMFNWGIEQDLIEVNPAHLVKKITTTEKDRTLSDDEIKAVLLKNDCESARILSLTLFTGARPGECQRMKHEDVTGEIWSCKQIKGGRVSTKKTPLVKSALELFKGKKGLVFPDLVSLNGLNKYVKRNFHIEGANNWTPHDLRRTVATKLKQMGYPAEHVSALLGHSPGKMNKTYMVHDYIKEKREMLLAWEQELKRIKTEG